MEVYLPEETYDALSLETTDGDLFFDALQAERLEVRTQSGDAELSGVYQELAFASHNGDFLCRDVTVEQLACQTTSGDMEISGKLSQITATSTSGDVSLRTSQMITSATIQSTSGDVLLLPPGKRRLYGAAPQLVGRSDLRLPRVPGRQRIPL